MGASPVSNTKRSREVMESEGWVVDVVEYWNHFAAKRHDLFNLWDLLGVHPEKGETLAVQTTSASNVSSRIKKITDSPILPAIRKAGWKLEVHGWAKVKGRWTLKRRENVS